MTVWVTTCIGAVAAIAGGWVGAWWQARHTSTLARQIRREERREAGLMTLNATVTEISELCDRAYRVAERDPDQWHTSWTDTYNQVERLRLVWESTIAATVPDTDVVQAYTAARGQAHDCLARFGAPANPPAGSADPKEFVRDAGRLLMLLGELKKATSSQLDPLLTFGD
jgi:hypothetical protein